MNGLAFRAHRQQGGPTCMGHAGQKGVRVVDAVTGVVRLSAW
jgi:hypothetical protein